MRNVLFIAYLFPPLGGGGVQRTLAFVEELPARGWRPTVICAGADADYWAKDRSLLAQIPPEAKVVRVPEGPLGWARNGLRRLVPRRLRPAFDSRFMIPDRAVPWMPGAIGAASTLRLWRRFDAIYSTGAPWTNHLVALTVARTSGLPWVADFRDPWTRSAGVPIPEEILSVHHWLESEVYAAADHVIANTQFQRADLEAHYLSTRGKTSCIPNGFREADFDRPLPAASADRKMLGYAGSFYAGYGASPLHERLRRIQQTRPRSLEGWSLRFVGRTEAHDDIEDAPIPAERFGYVPQERSLELMSECRALVVFIPEVEHAEGWVPQKLYVYLRLGRPILAIGKEGEAMDILRASGGPHLCLTADVPDDDLADWLEHLPRQVDHAPEFLRPFTRAAQADRLAEVFEALPGAEARGA